MGRDKSRAHLLASHRIDHNAEQQIEELRQKLAEVGVKLCMNKLLHAVVSSESEHQCSSIMLNPFTTICK